MLYQLWDIKREQGSGEFSFKVVREEISYEDFMYYVAGIMAQEKNVELWLIEEDETKTFHIKVKFVWQRH